MLLLHTSEARIIQMWDDEHASDEYMHEDEEAVHV